MPLPGLEEMQRRSRELRRPAPSDSSFLESAGRRIAAGGLSTLAAAGDILSRPAYGVSEAYGEHAEGGTPSDVLEGLLRGVTGGFQEAEHPTFGERAVPYEEGEDFGRKATRFGVDVLTDPLTLLGGPAAKVVGKGGIAAARLAKGSKLGKALGESEFAQMLSRGIMGTDYNMASVGGLEGAVAVGRARRGLEKARGMAAMPKNRVMAEIQRLGVKANDEDFWTRVTEAGERGDLASATPESQMARVLREEYSVWDDKFSTFKDKAGDIFETYNPVSGESVPFHSLPNYMARYLKPEVAQNLLTKRGQLKQAGTLSKQLGITKGEAERIIRYETGHAKRAGNIEYARLSNNPDIFDRNALRNFMRYTDEASKRFALAEEFGVKHGRLQQLLDRAMTRAKEKGLDRGFAKTIETFRQGVEGRYEPSPLAGIASDILGYQVLAKMGPTSVIAQFGQHVNSAVQQGVGNYVRGLYRISSNPQVRRDSMMAVVGGAERQMEQLIGTAAGGGGLGARAAAKYLRVIGFNFADELPRRITYAGAIATAEKKALQAVRRARTGGVRPGIQQGSTMELSAMSPKAVTAPDELLESIRREGITTPLEIGVNPRTGARVVLEGDHRLAAARRLGVERVPFREVEIGDDLERVLRRQGTPPASSGGWTQDLGRMGITKSEFEDFASMVGVPGVKPKFRPTTEARIGLRASKATQFEPDFVTLPPLWQTPEMRIAMQFRSFIHQQSRFLWEGVMKPAVRYMDTGGKEGSLMPMARALMMYPVAGQGVAAARELFREATARATGIKREGRFKRKFDYEHPLAQMARDSLYVGAFGLGGDLLEQASRGQLLEWMAGPTVTDVTGTFERAYGTGLSALEGDYPTLEDVATTGARHIPGRRLVPLTPREIGEGVVDYIR